MERNNSSVKKVVRLYAGDDDTRDRALAILKGRCQTVVVTTKTKVPIVASEDGVFEGLERIKYYAEGWL